MSNSNPFSLYSFSDFPVNKAKHIDSKGQSRCELTSVVSETSFYFSAVLTLRQFPPSSLPPKLASLISFFICRNTLRALRISQMVVGAQR